MDVYYRCGDQNSALHKSEDISETPNMVLVTKLQVRSDYKEGLLKLKGNPTHTYKVSGQ